MADLTIGEIGIVVQQQLMAQDLTQSPPVQTPLDLTNAQKVEMLFFIGPPNYSPPQPPVKTVLMGILSPPSSGTVFYSFQSGDLSKPSNMGKNGVFKYAIRVTFNNGNVFYTNFDGQFTIKDDSVL